MNNIIDLVSKQYGVTAQEVEADIKEAISIAMNNPQARTFWSAFKEAPSVEELINILSLQIKKRRDIN